MVEIVQFSDLHYGSGEFDPKCFDNIVNYINDPVNKIDVAVCTGDVTHKGSKEQYEEVAALLKRIKIPLIIIPGNHDCKNNGLIFFEDYISKRRSKLILDAKDAIIVGCCSAKDDLSDGEIGDEQLIWVAKQFKNPISNRIIALHHHLLPIPYAGRKFTIVHDAGEILEMANLFEIDVVLMGHRHVPHCYVIGPTAFIYCGTSTTNKVRSDESPSFNHISLNDNNLEVNILNSTNLEKTILLTKKDGITKYVRPRKTRIEHLLSTDVFSDDS